MFKSFKKKNTLAHSYETGCFKESMNFKSIGILKKYIGFLKLYYVLYYDINLRS